MLVMMYVLFGVVVLAYFLSRLRKNRRLFERYIQGQWIRKGTASDGTAWQIIYRFQGDQLQIKAEPKFEQQGRFRIISEVEQQLVIEAYDLKGDDLRTPLPLTGSVSSTTEAQESNPPKPAKPADRMQLVLAVDPDMDRLVINGRTYQRFK